jgi:hypothetical protein
MRLLQQRNTRNAKFATTQVRTNVQRAPLPMPLLHHARQLTFAARAQGADATDSADDATSNTEIELTVVATNMRQQVEGASAQAACRPATAAEVLLDASSSSSRGDGGSTAVTPASAAALNTSAPVQPPRVQSVHGVAVVSTRTHWPWWIVWLALATAALSIVALQVWPGDEVDERSVPVQKRPADNAAK